METLLEQSRTVARKYLPEAAHPPPRCGPPEHCRLSASARQGAVVEGLLRVCGSVVLPDRFYGVVSIVQIDILGSLNSDVFSLFLLHL